MDLKQAEQTKKLIKIYNHFGRDAQINKLREEFEEFVEALQSGNMEHATEEFADMVVVLSGISVGENIIDDLFSSTFDYKVDRTIARIDSGYYEDVEKAVRKCSKCKHYNNEPYEEPCNRCLNAGHNEEMFEGVE